jgi:cell division protease FtsH
MVFGDENEEVFLGYSMGQVQSYSEQTAAEIDEEIKSIIDNCYEETKSILYDKSNVIQGLATRLIEKLTVDGPDFEKIYEADGDLSVVFPQDYSGIDTTGTVAEAIKEEPAAETTAASDSKDVESQPVKPSYTDSEDDSNDPGPSD